LDISFNSLSGTIPSSISGMAALTMLDLHSNYLTGSVPAITLEKLSAYNFNLNLLTGTLPSTFSLSLTDDASSTAVTSGPLTFLQRGSIANITAEGNALCAMAGLGLTVTTLTTPWVYCQGSRDGLQPSAQQYAANPHSWYTSYSSKTDSPYKSCSTPYQPPWCCVPWTGITCTSNYNILSIDISYASRTVTLANRLPSTMGAFSALTSLTIAGTAANPGNIVGSLPSSLATISTLVSLDASYQRLIGTIPQFGALNTQLTKLKLNANSFSGILPLGLGNIGTALVSLDVSSNKLVGSIPSTLSACTAMTYLSFAINSLNGPIPTYFGTFNSLAALYLDNNAFTGPYPSSANWPASGALRITDSPSPLTFQNNFLTGTVPSGFEVESSLTMSTYTTQRSTTASGSNTGVVLGGSQVFTGVTVALANSPKFSSAYKLALAAVVGVPSAQVALGTATAVSLTSRRALEERDLTEAEAAAAAAVEEAINNGEDPEVARELLAAKPNPIPPTTVSYPFSITVFASQGSATSVQTLLAGAGQTASVTAMMVAATGVATIAARAAAVSSTVSASLNPTTAPTAMPTYVALPAQPTSRTITPPPFTDPATKAAHCKQCLNQNYCAVPLGCLN
jgi:hypothetical protein